MTVYSFLKDGKSVNHKEWGIAAALWMIIGGVYGATMAPTVGFIDSGELSAVASTLGIAHPTGYPLFTLIGRLFVVLPIGHEEIVRLNLMSALFTSLAAVAFFFLVLELLEPNRSRRTAAEYGAASFSTLALSFSQTFWRQAVSVEVYSLHLLLLCVTLWALMKGVNSGSPRWWYLFAFVLGLSFTNHLTTIHVVPALLFLFFAEHGFRRSAFQRSAQLSVPFLLGLSVYLFLPIRAASHPVFNWGNPQTLEKFLWHVSGKQFRVWMFSSTDSARKQWNYFLEQAPAEFFYIPIAVAVIGLLVMVFAHRRTLVFLFLLAVTCVGYSVNYDIHDIDSYFLLAYVTFMIFASFGFRRIIDAITPARGTFSIGAIVLVLSGVQVFANWKDVDQRQHYHVEDYTKAILTSLPSKAVILSYQWDYFVSASYYYQQVRNLRPDVVVIDKELLRRSWYFDQLEKMYPLIMHKSRFEIESFQRELNKFEHDLPYDYEAIEGRYTVLIKSFIEKNIDSVSLFVTGEIEQEYTAGYNRVPFGLIYKLSRDQHYQPAPLVELPVRSGANSNIYINQLKRITSTIFFQRGEYERFFGHDSLASLYFSASKNALK